MSGTVGGAIGTGSIPTLTDATIRNIEKRETGSSDPSVLAEKGEANSTDTAEDEGTLLLSHEEQFPIDPDGEVEEQQFTFRAVIVGCILGGVIAASKYGFGTTPRVMLLTLE